MQACGPRGGSMRWDPSLKKWQMVIGRGTHGQRGTDRGVWAKRRQRAVGPLRERRQMVMVEGRAVKRGTDRGVRLERGVPRIHSGAARRTSEKRGGR